MSKVPLLVKEPEEEIVPEPSKARVPAFTVVPPV
jgi:hypothetical protein